MTDVGGTVGPQRLERCTLTEAMVDKARSAWERNSVREEKLCPSRERGVPKTNTTHFAQLDPPMTTDLSSFLSLLRSACLVVLGIGLFVRCDAITNTSPNEPPVEPYPLVNADSTTPQPGIEVLLWAPDTVALGDPFTVQVRINNENDDTVRVVTGTPALYDFGVYDGSEALPLEGTSTLLPQVETEQDLPPTELVREPQLRAARFSDKEAPIAPGTYTNRLMLNWQIDGTRARDTLETTIVFRDE